MNSEAARTVMWEARACAMSMLESATYIMRELPGVQMDDPTRSAAAELCGRFVETKHDVLHELWELDQLLSDGAGFEEIRSAMNLIMGWLFEDIQQMHKLVISLQEAAERDPECGSAYVLVAESGVNILRPFGHASAALEQFIHSGSAENN